MELILFIYWVIKHTKKQHFMKSIHYISVQQKFNFCFD